AADRELHRDREAVPAHAVEAWALARAQHDLGAVRGGAVEALRAVVGGCGDVHDALPVVQFGVQRRRFTAADPDVPARLLAQSAEGDAAYGRLLTDRVLGTVDLQVGSGRCAVDQARRARGEGGGG